MKLRCIINLSCADEERAWVFSLKEFIFCIGRERACERERIRKCCSVLISGASAAVARCLSCRKHFWSHSLIFSCISLSPKRITYCSKCFQAFGLTEVGHDENLTRLIFLMAIGQKCFADLCWEKIQCRNAEISRNAQASIVLDCYCVKMQQYVGALLRVWIDTERL